jgi:hypothetical protein
LSEINASYQTDVTGINQRILALREQLNIARNTQNDIRESMDTRVNCGISTGISTFVHGSEGDTVWQLGIVQRIASFINVRRNSIKDCWADIHRSSTEAGALAREAQARYDNLTRGTGSRAEKPDNMDTELRESDGIHSVETHSSISISSRRANESRHITDRPSEEVLSGIADSRRIRAQRNRRSSAEPEMNRSFLRGIGEREPVVVELNSPNGDEALPSTTPSASPLGHVVSNPASHDNVSSTTHSRPQDVGSQPTGLFSQGSADSQLIGNMTVDRFRGYLHDMFEQHFTAQATTVVDGNTSRRKKKKLPNLHERVLEMRLQEGKEASKKHVASTFAYLNYSKF